MTTDRVKIVIAEELELESLFRTYTHFLFSPAAPVFSKYIYYIHVYIYKKPKNISYKFLFLSQLIITEVKYCVKKQ